MDINYNFLRSFSELAQTLNFSKAAKNLNMAQPGLSRQIKQLEESLNVTLFKRDNKRVSLTQEGEYLKESLIPLLVGVDETLRNLKNQSSGVFGRITIACPLEVGEYLIAPICNKFSSLYPEVEIAIQFVSTSKIPGLILAGDVDFGVSLYIADQENIRTYKLIEQQAFLLSANKNADTENLKDLEYVGYRYDDPLVLKFIKSFSPRANYSKIKIKFSANSHSALVDYLIDNPQYFGVLPYFSKPVVNAIDDNKLHIVKDYKLESDLYLLCSVENTQAQRTKLFREFILNEIKEVTKRA